MRKKLFFKFYIKTYRCKKNSVWVYNEEQLQNKNDKIMEHI